VLAANGLDLEVGGELDDVLEGHGGVVLCTEDTIQI
jgi:hypothetical protein